MQSHGKPMTVQYSRVIGVNLNSSPVKPIHHQNYSIQFHINRSNPQQLLSQRVRLQNINYKCLIRIIDYGKLYNIITHYMQHYNVSKCTILWKQYDNTVYKLIEYLRTFIFVMFYLNMLYTNCELGDVNEHLLKYFFDVAILNILLKQLYHL